MITLLFTILFLIVEPHLPLTPELPAYDDKEIYDALVANTEGWPVIEANDICDDPTPIFESDWAITKVSVWPVYVTDYSDSPVFTVEGNPNGCTVTFLDYTKWQCEVTKDGEFVVKIIGGVK